MRDSFTSITRLPEKSEVYGLMHAKAVKIAKTAILIYFDLKNTFIQCIYWVGVISVVGSVGGWSLGDQFKGSLGWVFVFVMCNAKGLFHCVLQRSLISIKHLLRGAVNLPCLCPHILCTSWYLHHEFTLKNRCSSFNFKLINDINKFNGDCKFLQHTNGLYCVFLSVFL